jgi:hypothetical protein
MESNTEFARRWGMRVSLISLCFFFAVVVYYVWGESWLWAWLSGGAVYDHVAFLNFAYRISKYVEWSTLFMAVMGAIGACIASYGFLRKKSWKALGVILLALLLILVSVRAATNISERQSPCSGAISC